MDGFFVKLTDRLMGWLQIRFGFRPPAILMAVNVLQSLSALLFLTLATGVQGVFVMVLVAGLFAWSVMLEYQLSAIYVRDLTTPWTDEKDARYAVMAISLRQSGAKSRRFLIVAFPVIVLAAILLLALNGPLRMAITAGSGIVLFMMLYVRSLMAGAQTIPMELVKLVRGGPR